MSWATWATLLTLGQSGADDAFFESKIRPVLVESCFKCHGGAKTSSGLRVDSRAALVRGGETGAAVIPGQPDKSLLVQAIRHSHKELRMPPGKKLPDHVVADFAKWIQRGASWPATTAGKSPFEVAQHWAFLPVKKVTPPDDPTGWAKHPVDRFLAAKWREKGLTPVAPADRRTLLRRVTFDLIGLPPSPEDMDAFLNDTAPDAFAKVVDRLLASPHYGERWGRHWMDVVRYADTAGDNADYPIPEIHRYRDYIIDSIQNDKPFDQFVQEQLAGDILARAGPKEKFAERVVATGFLALSRRYATAPYELWHLTLEDTIDTTGMALLGLTMRCARCHDHKFDPITREDYYGLYSIFDSTVFPWAGGEEFASMARPREHFVPLAPGPASVMDAYRKQLADLDAAIKKLPKDDPKAKSLLAQQKTLLRRGLPTEVPGAYAVQDGKPKRTQIHLQGDPEKPGPAVARRVPQFLEGSPVAFPAEGSGRLELARWITRPDHPLTARVLVNRVWQTHFGQGLVTTPNNFGTRGEPPSHPELLDHLAGEFVKNGWSLKWLHRYLLSTRTYALASNPGPDLVAKDPDNRWLSHYARRRLDAEALRDAMLLVSGKLDTKRPGPHPFPPIDTWNWTQHTPFKDIYPSNHRSVYLMTPRIQRHPFLALFDGPDTNASTEKRGTSLVPQQALYLMNHPLVREQAQSFAERILDAKEPRVAWAHQVAWGRHATPDEIARALQYVSRHKEEARRQNVPAARLDIEAWTSYARILMTANEFLFID